MGLTSWGEQFCDAQREVARRMRLVDSDSRSDSNRMPFKASSALVWPCSRPPPLSLSLSLCVLHSPAARPDNACSLSVLFYPWPLHMLAQLPGNLSSSLEFTTLHSPIQTSAPPSHRPVSRELSTTSPSSKPPRNCVCSSFSPCSARRSRGCPAFTPGPRCSL